MLELSVAGTFRELDQGKVGGQIYPQRREIYE